MRYLLDTNICIYIIKRKPPAVLEKFRSCSVGDVGISVITEAELRYGVEKSQRPLQNEAALNQFLAPLVIAAFDSEAAGAYGRIRAELESQGNPIGPLDTLIAAHALSLGATLVTNNTREFARIPGLQIADWTTIAKHDPACEKEDPS